MAHTALEQIGQSTQRVESVKTRRTRIQVQLESARQQFSEAVAEAEANFGTADLDKLRAILTQQEADNTKASAEFIRAIDDFERFIVRIEDALANPESMAALVAAMEPVAVEAQPSPAAVPAAVTFDASDI